MSRTPSCPIPTGMDDLTAEWLTCALDREVTDVDRTQIGTGQIADSVRLAITYADGTTGSLVAKVTSANETSRRAALMTRTYEKEAGFFADLADEVQIRRPACYWTGFDADAAAYCVLLEDLAPAEQGDQMRGCTVDEAALAVDEMALLHGPMWNATGLDGRFAWLSRGSGTTDPGSVSLVDMFLPGFFERYEERLPADVVELTRRALPNLARSTAFADHPHTVIHGDFRNDNLMFGHPDGRVCVLDWQTLGIGNGLSDLSYFLGGSLLVEDRRDHERELLQRYLTDLSKHGVELDEDEAWTAYRRYAFSGLMMAVVASMLVGRTDRGDDMFMAMAERAGRHALDLDSEAVL
jgi:hypothetical protein